MELTSVRETNSMRRDVKAYYCQITSNKEAVIRENDVLIYLHTLW